MGAEGCERGEGRWSRMAQVTRDPVRAFRSSVPGSQDRLAAPVALGAGRITGAHSGPPPSVPAAAGLRLDGRIDPPTGSLPGRTRGISSHTGGTQGRSQMTVTSCSTRATQTPE